MNLDELNTKLTRKETTPFLDEHWFKLDIQGHLKVIQTKVRGDARNTVQDDLQVDEDVPARSPLTRHKVLKAVSIIGR